MIPKVIHYCWLSGEPFPKLIEDCIQSWKKYMPSYEFVLWDTKRFDINSNLYVKQAYEAKKYAFASDYIRLYALYHVGGIYLDTDIQVFKSFDNLLDRKAFTGFEHEEAVAAWLMASEKGNPLFGELLEHYKNRKFLFPNGSFDLTTNVNPVTNTFVKHGLILNGQYQELDMITVFPRTYFCPVITYSDKYSECYSDNTYAQHLFHAGWIDDQSRALIARKHAIAEKYGELVSLVYYGLVTLKKEGIFSFCKQWKVRIDTKRNKKQNGG